LDMVAAAGQPKLWELTPGEARQKVIELTAWLSVRKQLAKPKMGHCQGQEGRFFTGFIRRWQLTTSRQVG
jgi:hypothetical protein